MLKPTVLAAAGMLVCAGFAAAQDAAVRLEFGVLSCQMTGRANIIIASETRFACIFEHADGRPAELFGGVIDKVGVDLSLKADERLVWGVLAPSLDAPVAAMEGLYLGVGADVALGAGIGANALLGGFEKSFALQPLSVSGSEGVGVSVAIQGFRLTYEGLAQ